MKRFIFGALTGLQALLFAGIFVLDNVSHHHMTFYRNMLFRNRQWEADFHIAGVLLGVRFVLLAVAVWAIFILARRIKRERRWRFFPDAQLLGFAVCAAGSATFLALNSTANISTYYPAAGLVLLITVLQAAKIPLFNRNKKVMRAGR